VRSVDERCNQNRVAGEISLGLVGQAKGDGVGNNCSLYHENSADGKDVEITAQSVT